MFLSRTRKVKCFAATTLMVCGVIVTSSIGFAAVEGENMRANPQYNRDIRPILSETCFQCHGPDKNQRKAKLRLDVRDAALEKKAFVPGKPDESELIKRIFTKDPDDVMPPPESHKSLTAEQKEILKRWIAAGAEYQPHWAYIVPIRPPVPAVSNKQWVKNPIDAFILEKLDAHKIHPSSEVDKRTLIRRLTLDLLGLPPTQAEVAAFLSDKSAKAYERLVDRLLRSPHYGERMAVPWLDEARYADTVGYHGDQNQRIFPYRDYVIDSFNRNLPFDQFTIEQIAGDLLPNATPAQRVASGFNRLNMMTREGGAQPGEYMAKYAADRVRTISTTWLGSTMGCCECHDHKYDPFTAKDFYSMAAFFSDLKQWGVYMDYNYTPNPDLRGWSNDHPFPPEIEVASPYLSERRKHLEEQIDQLVARHEEKARDAWIKSTAAFLKQNRDGWEIPVATLLGSSKETNSTIAAGFYARQPDGSVLLRKKVAETDRLQVPLSQGWLASIRLELLPTEYHTNSILRTANKGATIQFAAVLLQKGSREIPLQFYHADSNHKEDRFVNGEPLIGIRGAWKTDSKMNGAVQSGVWLLDPPIHVSANAALVITLKDNQAGCVRIATSPLAFADPRNPIIPSGARKALGLQLASRERAGERVASTPSNPKIEIARLFATSTAFNGDTNSFTAFKKLYREVLECRDGRAFTMVSETREPIVTRVLPRGNWQDESGAVVSPRPPSFLKPEDSSSPRQTRLDLARWIVSPQNPLTARNFVNRLWKQYFGNGICNTVEDLGAQGEWPSHPELLDWLAVEFRESGWDIKHMVMLMVMSSTYRQSSNLRNELREVDPNNRLLSSQNPRRLEAEFVRDNALAIAGLLNPDLGGPSVHPYQPSGYYANLQFPDRDYIPEKDDRQYRRGVYSHWQRAFLNPMLANFDAPSREECTALRTVSNTPQQALTLLNDPSFVEAARVWAQKLLSGKKLNDQQMLETIFQRALARSVKPQEKDSLLKFLGDQRTYYSANPQDAQKLSHAGVYDAAKNVSSVEEAAWAEVCRVVLNLHETITKY